MYSIYKERRISLVNELNRSSIDYSFITDPANIFYYTGFLTNPHERFLSLFVNVQKNEFVLFVPALDEDAASQFSDLHPIIPISDEEIPFEVIQNKVGTIEGKVGIEGTQFSYRLIVQCQKYFSRISFVDIQEIVNEQRLIKSTNEVVAIKKAITIIENVLEDGMKYIREGMKEIELTAELEYLMRRHGADAPSFSTIVLAGENAALPHGSPGQRKIEQGDVVLIDFGVIKDGYCSDITRTFAVKYASNEVRDIYNVVLESNEQAIQTVKADVPLKTFDIAARNVIHQAGFGQYFNNRVGHGLGIEVHEAPSIHQQNNALAKSGMVFTIEPGIYIPNKIGVRIEDIVYINEAGEGEVLTSFPKELIVLQ